MVEVIERYICKLSPGLLKDISVNNICWGKILLKDISANKICWGKTVLKDTYKDTYKEVAWVANMSMSDVALILNKIGIYFFYKMGLFSRGTYKYLHPITRYYALAFYKTR